MAASNVRGATLSAPVQDQGSAAGMLEMAHVLFMDIVAYSKLPMEEQRSRIKVLQEAVRNTEEFARAQKKDRLLCLPTGDGLALVFFGDLEAPARCAVELGRALRDHPELKLRMGIHSGPIYRVADINANLNVAGSGINMAQRVMDVGDEGHILVSRTVADMLTQVGKWGTSLQDLGEAEVKHGVHVHIYNLATQEAGNPQPPQKMKRSGSSDAAPVPAAVKAASQSAIEPAMVDSVSKELALFIGPIAKVVVRRAAERCSSIQELYSAVAAEIENEKDRAKFLDGRKRR
jgi:class 3 adenylate cyclase